MVMCNNKFETKGSKILTKDKIERPTKKIVLSAWLGLIRNFLPLLEAIRLEDLYR